MVVRPGAECRQRSGSACVCWVQELRGRDVGHALSGSIRKAAGEPGLPAKPFALCAPVASPDADAIFVSDADAIFISDADAIFVSDADAIFISDADAIFVSDAASYASALCAPVTNPECAANF